MFRGFDEMFGNMNKMMNDMMGNSFGMSPGFPLMNNMLMPSMSNNIMTPFGGDDNSLIMLGSGFPGGVSFSSSVTTFSNDGSGRPQVYQSTKSQICGPNGVKETTETVRDSRTGLQQMTHGRHINDRAHIKQKKRNIFNGDEEEEEELQNLDEEELEEFQQEFKQKRGSFPNTNSMYRSIGYKGNNNPRLAITTGPSASHNIQNVYDNHSRPSSRNKKPKESEEDKSKKKQKKSRKPYGKI